MMDMRKLRVLDLFSGTGGFSLGLERSGGFQTVAFCEIEEFPRSVLKKHWPKVPCYHDVRQLTAERLAADGIAVDVICGGFPCQDLSRANGVWTSRPGLQGARSGLWSEFARLIGELLPRYVILENVSALVSELGTVLRDLAALGYDAEWDCLHTTIVGGRCTRERLWLVSYPGIERLQGQHGQGVQASHAGRIFDDVARIAPQIAERQDWLSEPAVPRVVDGTPNRMDRKNRTIAIGNAIPPQLAELFGQAILNSRKNCGMGAL